CRFGIEADPRPGFRHELASALALFSMLATYAPEHAALLGPWTGVLAKLGHQIPAGRAVPEGSADISDLLSLGAEDFDLLVYQVASHHGKVRVGLHAAPKDQDYETRDDRGMPVRGVRNGDTLAALPGLEITLEPATMGLSAHTGRSWRDRVSGLLARFGPCALAYLEALMRAADVRSSRLDTVDPLLQKEVQA
ncbi:MAG TPA: hypothetical protein VHA11_14510, partial [Bryobacteraceae bacterium]|nr:hypothetical protein [Bryobacteraceae bacterium]